MDIGQNVAVKQVLLSRDQLRAIRRLRFEHETERRYQEYASIERIRRIRIVVVTLILLFILIPAPKEVTATPLMKQAVLATVFLTLAMAAFVFISRFRRQAIYALPIWHLLQQVAFAFAAKNPIPFMQSTIELSLAVIIIAAVRSPAWLSMVYAVVSVGIRIGAWLYSGLPFADFSGALSYFLLGMIFLVIGAYLTEIADRKSFLMAGLLEAERDRTQNLLTNVLPPSVAERLKTSTDVFARGHDDVTILFADVANFTPFAADHSPAEVVGFLNDLFSRFDQLVDTAGLEKIKTVGDAYMVAGGLPEPFEGHVSAVASLALEMKGAAAAAGADVRFGVHCGPVVAGVLGSKRLMYDVWGSTVNIASRLEGAATPGQILVSDAVAKRLEGSFELSSAGTMELKGVGPVTAFTLNRRSASAMPLG